MTLLILDSGNTGVNGHETHIEIVWSKTPDPDSTAASVTCLGLSVLRSGAPALREPTAHSVLLRVTKSRGPDLPHQGKSISDLAFKFMPFFI